METFYKYSKYHDLKSFIKPVIRLSPTRVLNDPFESRLNQDVITNIHQKLSASGVGFDLPHNFPKKFETPFLMSRIHDEVDSYGIVSLSETPRNILMWAHYANEHEGICVEYRNDLFESLPDKVFNEFSFAERYMPVKVNYDNIRPQVLSEAFTQPEKLKHYIYQQLTTKSDDWMYEKEHRCLIPTQWADEVKIIPDSDADIDMRQSELIQGFIRSGKIKKNENGNYEGPLLGVMISVYKRAKGAVFLKNIQKNSIVSIYLGLRFDRQKRNELISYLSKKDNGLSHINIYQCSLSDNRFEIKPYPVSLNIT
ncbi:DUF2971 domain-containing protein [Aeromonas hydrophila]|uniref:DUF2971 domain-containing protein n=1 Tax=Aeromonas hydrophila TaxID=644 RepID=UPI000C32DDDE|nr:DUF2971 domain-containing protein [Aeromonas hydrophila]PKD25720.1 hypothetical protein AO056_00795 [Aeromonas hydrophila]HAU4892960.1 DUF2971 domain-containing protein [Aeromonas hydrophila]HAU4973956.1 DUF2971 domain-containing protein [Aeromonas hydrophila]HAU4982857.1 DUF2971 domain-containing protein [Aeromonas hydrophila]